MPDLDTKLNTLESLAALLATGAQVLIARIGDEYRIATALQLDGEDGDADNHYPNLVLLSGLDPDGEYCIETAEASTLDTAMRYAALVNGVAAT